MEFWLAKFTPNPSFARQNENFALPLMMKNGAEIKMTDKKCTLRGRCAFAPLRYAHPRITRAIREMARLAISPNFAPFSRKTSYSPDVM